MKYYVMFLLTIFLSGCFLFEKENESLSENGQSNVDDPQTEVSPEELFDDEEFAKYFEVDSLSNDEENTDNDLVEDGNTSSEKDKVEDFGDERKTYTRNIISDRIKGEEEGEYLVITGSFTIKENAESQVRNLKNKGYQSAEVVYFAEREYHTACAGKFDSEADAKSVARELKNTYNIPAYVHKKRYVK